MKAAAGEENNLLNFAGFSRHDEYYKTKSCVVMKLI